MMVPEGGSTFMHNMTMLVDEHGHQHAIPVEAYDDVFWTQTQVVHTDLGRRVRRDLR